MSRVRPFLALLMTIPALMLGACGSDKVTAVPEPVIETATFAPALNVNLATSTKTFGMYYRDLSPGSGDVAVAGKTVSLHYSGWLSDGTSFEVNGPNDAPITFTLGTGKVIPGWDIGINGMKVGGQRQLIIPPSLAYGATTNGKIPGNSILVFTVSLVSVK